MPKDGLDDPARTEHGASPSVSSDGALHGLHVPPDESPFCHGFFAAYEELRRVVAAFPQDGVLFAALWKGRSVDSYVHVALNAAPVFAIAGRHDRCDLVLPKDSAVSLRHLVVSCRVKRQRDLCIRVWDLDSRIGLHTEQGLPCQALVCEGPLFLRVGEYYLYMIPTGTLSYLHWDDGPAEAWASFPERVLLDQRISTRYHSEQRKEGTGSVRLPARLSLEKNDEPALDHSIITEILPPAKLIRANARAVETAPAVGELLLISSEAEACYPVAEKDIQQGLLIGRYQRCQLGADSTRLSRIHALIVKDGGEVWLIDTASTNGTKQKGARVRSARLDTESEFRLANVLKLRWQTPGNTERDPSIP